MTTRERSELILIALAAAGCVAVRDRFALSLPVGDVFLRASILLLGQGLIRDLWIKYAAREPAVREPGSAQPLRCMCMESTVGVLGVAIGLVLVFAAGGASVPLPEWFWPAMVGGVGLAGYLMKDLVLDFKAWKIRRETDHRNIVFW